MEFADRIALIVVPEGIPVPDTIIPTARSAVETANAETVVLDADRVPVRAAGQAKLP